MVYILNEEIHNGMVISSDYSFENIDDHFDDYFEILEVDRMFRNYENTFDCVYLSNTYNGLSLSYFERINESINIHILMDNFEIGCGF